MKQFVRNAVKQHAITQGCSPELIDLIDKATYTQAGGLVWQVPYFGKRVILDTHLYISCKKGDTGYIIGEGLDKRVVAVFPKKDFRNTEIVFTFTLDNEDFIFSPNQN